MIRLQPVAVCDGCGTTVDYEALQRVAGVRATIRGDGPAEPVTKVSEVRRLLKAEGWVARVDVKRSGGLTDWCPECQ